MAYSGKEAIVQQFRAYFDKITWESKLLERKGVSNRKGVKAPVYDTYDFEYCCYVDGSWTQGWKAGIGIYLKRK